MTTYERILEQISLLPVIDSHEHLPGSESKRDKDADVLSEYLAHYFSSDLVSAGLSPADLAIVADPSRPIMKRWELVAPYWDLARNTGYGRALDLAARDLYDIPRIAGDTIEELNDRFRKTLLPGANHFPHVLQELSRIEYAVVDSDPACDRTLFRSTCHITPFVTPKSWDEIEGIERDVGVPIASFDDWLDACRTFIDHGLAQGAVALKCTTAYTRTLLFEDATYQEAEESFNRNIAKKGRPSWENGACSFSKAFQDYMLHFILTIANRRGLVVQFHTGLQEGNRNYIRNADPSLMTNLFVRYPNVKFDIFHIGYPYQHVLSAIGKAFPNAYLDMCWAHVISPAACVETLCEWLDSVPSNKIIGFGGDYRFVDGVYAHQKMARENVSRALARKVDEGVFDADEAVRIARRLFYENPKALYGA